MVLISYDVATGDKEGSRRLRHVAKICSNYGQRVQYSLFECIVQPFQWTFLKKELIDKIDLKRDSLRFYFLGANWRRRIEHLGAKKSFDPEGPLIV